MDGPPVWVRVEPASSDPRRGVPAGEAVARPPGDSCCRNQPPAKILPSVCTAIAGQFVRVWVESGVERAVWVQPGNAVASDLVPRGESVVNSPPIESCRPAGRRRLESRRSRLDRNRRARIARVPKPRHPPTAATENTNQGHFPGARMPTLATEVNTSLVTSSRCLGRVCFHFLRSRWSFSSS